jgi:hypothetical protein
MFGRKISGVDYAVDDTIESYKGLYAKPQECESSTMRLFSAIMNLPFFF